MKVLGYVRVSTDSQATEDKCGIDVQKEAIIKYCLEKEYDLIGFAVDVISGAKLDRPELNKILYATEKREYEAIVCFKTDRISRKIEEYYYIKMLLKKLDIDIYSTQEDFGAMGAFAPLMESFIVFVAQMERQNIILRTTSGKNIKKKQGNFVGGNAPYGYIIGEGKKLVLDAREAQGVQEIFRLRKQGLSYQKIADVETKRGLSRTGGKFDKRTIYQIVQNENFYRGFVNINGTWEKGEHQPILY